MYKIEITETKRVSQVKHLRAGTFGAPDFILFHQYFFFLSFFFFGLSLLDSLCSKH